MNERVCDQGTHYLPHHEASNHLPLHTKNRAAGAGNDNKFLTYGSSDFLFICGAVNFPGTGALASQPRKVY